MPAVPPGPVVVIGAGIVGLACATYLQRVLAPTVDLHRELAASVGAADLIQRGGLLIVYRSEASFAADAAANRLRADNGVKIDELNQDELRQIEPTLSPAYTRARFISENGYVRNPLRLR